MSDSRATDLKTFYSLLALLEAKLGGVRSLATCSGRMHWPARGIYFFMEEGERRATSGASPRIVRVGTHALKEGSATSLWTRLSQHRGQDKSGGGNHRGSIFRLIVGVALIERYGYDFPMWGVGNSASAEARASELALEREVSKVIGALPFLWLAIDDRPGPTSLRGYIERNAIALLSNFNKNPIDPPSEGWLGNSCDRERIRRSGLWNSNHVDEPYDPAFLIAMERVINEKAVRP
jgi:hypothetical protein